MITRRRWHTPFLVMMAAATLSLTGCADSATEPEPEATTTAARGTVYVGTVDASDANVGLVVKNNRLAGMICQDENASLRLDAVTLEDGTAELLQGGKAVGTVSVADDIAVGTIDFDGSKRKFRAEPAAGDAGIYRLAADAPDEPWDGWVVLNDGSYTGTSKSGPSAGRPWIDPDTDP